MVRLEITPLAKSCVKDAALYYAEEASRAVAKRFRDEFRAACKLLAQHPGIGSLRFAHLLEGQELRAWSLQRFPFRLFYVENGEVLRVLAVEHERRNPTANSVFGSAGQKPE